MASTEIAQPAANRTASINDFKLSAHSGTTAGHTFSPVVSATRNPFPALLLFALAPLLILALGCDRQTNRPDANGGNAVIIKKVLVLADVPISVEDLKDETYKSKIAEAHQKARLLLAEYSGRNAPLLEQDVLDLFQLRQEQAGQSRNVVYLTEMQSRQIYEGRRNATDDAFLDQVKSKRDGLHQRFTAKKDEILSKYAR